MEAQIQTTGGRLKLISWKKIKDRTVSQAVSTVMEIIYLSVTSYKDFYKMHLNAVWLLFQKLDPTDIFN